MENSVGATVNLHNHVKFMEVSIPLSKNHRPPEVVVKERNLYQFRIPEETITMLQTDKAHKLDQNTDATASSISMAYKTKVPIPPGTSLLRDEQFVKEYLSESSAQNGETYKQFSNFLREEIQKKNLGLDEQNNKRALSAEELEIRKKLDEQNRDQWLARAMKRNTDLLCLMERIRPLSKQRSFSQRIFLKYKKFAGTNIHNSHALKRAQSANDVKSLDGSEAKVEYEAKSASVLDYSQIVSTTENPAVLSREILIQLIHQHLATKKLWKTIDVLGKESGIRYNGFMAPPEYFQTSNNNIAQEEEEEEEEEEDKIKTEEEKGGSNNDHGKEKSLKGVVEEEDEQVLQIQKQQKEEEKRREEEEEEEERDRREKNWSIIRTLMQMGITNAQKPLQDIIVNSVGTLTDLNVDSEVQTASIYNHLEEEYAHELRKGLWEELSNPEEDNVEYNDEKDKEKLQKKLDAEEVEQGIGEKQIKAATLNKLVEKLTDYGAQDGKFLNTFLVTYRSFTVPEILLAKLLERYQVPNKPAYKNINQDWEKIKVQIQFRTGTVLTKWIDEFFSLDWNQQMIRMLTIFVEDVLLKDKQTARMGNTIRTKLNRRLQQQGKGDAYAVHFSEPPKPPEVPKNIFLKLDIYDISDIELARQLTRQEHDIYRRIEPSELLNQAWSKAKLRHRSPHVLKSTARFNSISNWVACQIINPESLRVRKTRWLKMINIAKHLFMLNNFNTLLAFLSGMQSAGVDRLKFTKEELDKKALEEYELLLKKMSADRSYSAYREHILSCTPPCTPYLGVYLTDLTFVEDGNPDFIVSKRTGRQLINWTKRRFIHNVISEIQTYQHKPYNIQPVYQIDRLLVKELENHQVVSDQDMYKISLQREPRSAKKEDLVL
jgi:son of sevenless-like protein